MSTEPGNRYAHLLQPIRDLSKVWKIEIAEELESYIEEAGRLVLTDPEDGATQLNFAEAALLIQGSTAIYSRKVELLYQLVYQALDLRSSNKAKDTVSGKRKGVQMDLWAQIPETDEFLTIDHLIKEGRNIFMDSGPLQDQQRQAMQRRVPLFLMPRDKTDRRKEEFRISSCSVHPSAAYLLQESDARLLDDDVKGHESMYGGEQLSPLAPAPPREVQDLDERLQEILREVPPPPSADDPSPVREEEVEPLQTKDTSREDAQKIMAPQGVLNFAADPWALLDEHNVSGQDAPLEAGKTTRRLHAKRFLMDAKGLPDKGSFCELQSDEALWSRVVSRDLASLLAAGGHPVESLFLAVASRMKQGVRFETQKALFSGAWLEFEDLFAAAAGKRRSLKAAANLKAPTVGHVDGESTPVVAEDCDLSDAEHADEVDGRDEDMYTLIAKPMGPSFALPSEQLMPSSEPDEERQRKEGQRREVARLEGMIQDAQSQYEATIRSHLQQMQKDTVDDGTRKFPELYANVRRWQDQLAPVLQEFESRTAFDIHGYSDKLLKKMTNICKGQAIGKTIPFPRLVHAQPSWQVCRRFLTCLILTNRGNTDLIYASEEQRLNNFGVKLLKVDVESPMIALEGEEAAACAPPPARYRKAAEEEDTPPPPAKRLCTRQFNKLDVGAAFAAGEATAADAAAAIEEASLPARRQAQAGA